MMGLAERMFERALARGELRSDLSPALSAALLFGAVEMSLTALVAGRMPKDDPGALALWREQLADALVRGLSIPSAAPRAWGAPMKRDQARSGRA
jgi:hypothetical protein